MRKILIALVLVLGFAPMSFAGDNIHEKDVPAVVVKTLMNLHPKAKNIEWEYKAKKGYYEAEFKVNGAKSEVKISASGALIEDDTTVYVDELPKAAKEYIDKEYKNPTIVLVKRLTEPAFTKYVVKIRYESFRGKRHYTLVFDKDGRVFKG